MKVLRRDTLKVMKIANLAYSFLTLVTNVVAVANTRQKRHRRWGIRPINRKKESEGLFKTLFKDMWELDDEQFFKYTRMTQNQFKEILTLVEKEIQKDRTKRHITPKERLLITLQ